MAFNTGLFWLHDDGLVNSEDDYSGITTGTVLTQATIDTAVAADKMAVVETGGARAAFVKPLLKSAGVGGGTNVANLHVFGAMGFGEPGQSDYQEKSKFVWSLGLVGVALGASSDVSDTAGDVFTSPTNVEFQSWEDSGTGTDHVNDIFSGLSANQTATNAVDMADLAIADSGSDGIGMTIIPGIEVFSQLIFVYDRNAHIHPDSLANALINLHY